MILCLFVRLFIANPAESFGANSNGQFYLISMYNLANNQPNTRVFEGDFVVSSQSMVGLGYPIKTLHDLEEDFDENRIEEYFEESYVIFLKQLNEFKNLEREVSAGEERELKFMLGALILAKNLLKDKRK